MRQQLVMVPALLLALAATPALAVRATQRAPLPVAPGAPEIYRGALVDTMTTRSHGSTSFELRLDGYTSDADMARLSELDTRKGPQALEDELYEHRLGYIRIDQTLGYAVSLARRVSGPDGDTIYAVMDRPLQLYEIWNALPSRDYPFSVVEIHVDRNGKLTGNLYPIAMVDLLGQGRLHIANELPRAFPLIGLELVRESRSR